MRRVLTIAALTALIAGFCMRAPVSAVLGESSVADAAMRGDRAAVRALVKQGADVNAAQGDGMTALHWAARQGDLETAQTLLYAGANLRASTRLGGYTPLLMASQLGHAQVIDALLKAGADPKSTTGNGASALMLAAATGRTEAVKTLLDHGADIHAKGPVRHETALMFAVANNRLDVIRMLIASGADVRAATKVTDLKAQTNPEEEEFLRGQRQSARGAQAAQGAVVVVDRGGAIRYRGRIDNAYADLGKPRQHVTSHDLRASLDALVAGRPVPAPETEALGCFIVDPASIRRK